ASSSSLCCTLLLYRAPYLFVIVILKVVTHPEIALRHRKDQLKRGFGGSAGLVVINSEDINPSAHLMTIREAKVVLFIRQDVPSHDAVLAGEIPAGRDNRLIEIAEAMQLLGGKLQGTCGRSAVPIIRARDSYSFRLRGFPKSN